MEKKLKNRLFLSFKRDSPFVFLVFPSIFVKLHRPKPLTESMSPSATMYEGSSTTFQFTFTRPFFTSVCDFWRDCLLIEAQTASSLKEETVSSLISTSTAGMLRSDKSIFSRLTAALPAWVSCAATKSAVSAETINCTDVSENTMSPNFCRFKPMPINAPSRERCSTETNFSA